MSFKPFEDDNSFWARRLTLIRTVVIPYQWQALNDAIPQAEPSYAVRNFRRAAGLEPGGFGGMVFQDSDVGKYLEALGNSLLVKANPGLEKEADELIEVILKAQEADGYLNTYFTLAEPGKRWSNLWECHELYSAGHLLEGAIAYYKGSGKRRLLDGMLRYVDLMVKTFGPNKDQLQGYDGHEEIELALLKLYDLEARKEYLDLAAFFIFERGKKPSFFHKQWEDLGHKSHWTKAPVAEPDLKYTQSHAPVLEQDEACGHAVRALYLYTAMADLACKTQDSVLHDACLKLWNNIVFKQMYITGGVGSSPSGEAFTFNYDLPNNTLYAETCASIGLIFFAQRLLRYKVQSVYADVIEQTLYNVILASLDQEGKHFFYVNPLEVWPEASRKNPQIFHVKPKRQAWFSCACCPPNLARLLSSLGEYVAELRSKTLYVHQYISGSGSYTEGDFSVDLLLQTAYPYENRIYIDLETEHSLRLGLRIPGWALSYQLSEASGKLNEGIMEEGYYLVDLEAGKHHLTLELGMKVEFLEAHPELRADAGKVCLRRGPLLYCFEEADNGPRLAGLELDCLSEPKEERFVLGTETLISLKVAGFKARLETWEGQLYRPYKPSPESESKAEPCELRAIPYFAWANREEGEMAVWMRRH